MYERIENVQIYTISQGGGGRGEDRTFRNLGSHNTISIDRNMREFIIQRSQPCGGGASCFFHKLTLTVNNRIF